LNQTYEAVYEDIAKQLFPHGLPGWIRDDGRCRVHAQIDSITIRALRDMGIIEDHRALATESHESYHAE
jgi:hypothetical protein